jgi:hypothetical protein
MTIYSIVLFLHIAGALGLFMALGLEWTSLYRLRRATSVEQVREWLNISSGVGRVGMASMLLLLGSGVYMTAMVWHGAAWIGVTIGALVLLAIVTVALTRRRMAAIQQAVAAADGGALAGLYPLLQQPALWVAIKVRVAVILGIVFLMTVKPDLGGSLLTIGVAAGLGLISALASAGSASQGAVDRLSSESPGRGPG